MCTCVAVCWCVYVYVCCNVCSVLYRVAVYCSRVPLSRVLLARYVYVCCSVVQCGAVCCSVLQCVVEGDSLAFTLCLVCARAHTQLDGCITIRCVYCNVLQFVAVCCTGCCSELHLTITQHTCRYVCCSMLQYKQVCALQCVAVCCSTSRYVRCSVLQCVAPYHHPTHTLRHLHNSAGGYLGMHAAVCCSTLQYVAVCCSMLQYVAVSCTSSTANALCARCAT